MCEVDGMHTAAPHTHAKLYADLYAFMDMCIHALACTYKCLRWHKMFETTQMFILLQYLQ